MTGYLEPPGIIQANIGSKPDLFWRTAMVVVMGVGILTGAALAIGPIVLLIAYWNVWLLILLVLTPLGAWIAVKTSGHSRKLLWHYSHLPEFTLFKDRIESVEWPNPVTKGVEIPSDDAPKRRTVSLESVTSVVASFCLVRQSLASHGRVITETAPILYVRYLVNGREDVLSIPFPSHGDKGVDQWLRHFSDRSTPLYYSARILFRHDTQVLTDAQRLEQLNTARDLVPYEFANGWQADEHELGTRWLAIEQQHRDEEEARDPALKEARAKHSLRHWIFQGLVFVWLGVTVFFQQLAARAGMLNPANPALSLLAVFLFGFLFFYLLRSYLRWPYIFIYSAGALVTGVLVLIPSSEVSAVEQEVASSFFLAAIAFQPFCWVPYLVVKKLTAKRNARNQQVPESQTAGVR